METLLFFTDKSIIVRSLMVQLLIELIFDESLPDAYILALENRFISAHMSYMLLQGNVLLINHELLED